jgi:hypothetical protein
MFKALGNALYKTPWWALLLGGLFTLLLLGLFTVPFNVIRLTDSGASRAENQAIQREIDHALGDSALGMAERVVGALAERTKDPDRKAELDIAMQEIADARRDAFNAQREARRAASEASREAAREARRAARDAAEAAQNAAREAATQARDGARNKIETLTSAREEMVELQTRVGHKDDAALASIDAAITQARESEREAEKALAELKRDRNFSIGLGPSSATSAKSAPTAPPAPSPPTPPGSPADPKAPKAPVAGVSKPGSVNFDVDTGEKRVRGQIDIIDGETPSIEIKTDDGKTTVVSATALTPELRDDIRRRVASDFRRVGIGSALILAFIPLFIMIAIAKVYIGRSRRAQELAKQKTQEAESANVNRQIVEAKLMALQAQVEPHFLYNTLANVQALTEVDPAQANQMTGHLIQYLRAALPKMRENISTVGQEIELVRAYLNILKMRMGTRLEFGIDVPDDVKSLPFPPLMLPSLVENAIKHGLEPQREGGRIDVSAEKVGEGDTAQVRLIVRDTGRGFSDAPVQAGGGVGLANIRERLAALFGERARLIMESNVPKGVIATIETPAQGASAFTAPAAPAAATPETPKSWQARTWRAATRTHSVWATILMKGFVLIVALLGLMFMLGLIALATGMMPLHIGGAEISGLEGMALGTVILLIAFGVLSIVALMVVGVLYGLGFLLVALAVGIPAIIILSVFPALAPFLFVAFLFYWFWWRKRAKPVNIRPPGP